MTHTEPEQTTWVDEPELPQRPRRRWLTPLTAALGGVLLAAGGFLVGVLVEKGQGRSGATSATAGFRRFGPGGGAAGGGGAGFGQGARAALANATIGQVDSLRGRTLYLTTTDGNTVQVNVPAGESVSRTTSVGVRDIHPGDTVIVQGSADANGTIAASSVRATAANGSGGGLFGGGGSSAGGGSAGGGGSSAGGGSSGQGGGGGNGNLNQLFQPGG